MTTRQNLNRRQLHAMFFLILLVFVLVAWRAAFGRSTTNDYATDTLGVLGMSAVVFYLWRTPCVSCQKPLGLFALTWAPAAYAKSSPRCDHCGVSIDHDNPPDSRRPRL